MLLLDQMELLELENKTIKVIKISEWKTNKTNIISMVCEALKAHICEALTPVYVKL